MVIKFIIHHFLDDLNILSLPYHLFPVYRATIILSNLYLESVLSKLILK